MVNVKQLQKQNQRLKDQLSKRTELKKLEEERIRLQDQNKKLISELKRDPRTEKAKKVLGVVGRGFFRGGVTVGKGLIAYGRFLDEKERGTRRKVKTLKKSSSKRRK